jgi:hypothetical protein
MVCLESRCAANGEWEVHAFFDKTPTRGSFSTGKDSAFCLYQAWISNDLNDLKWQVISNDFKCKSFHTISNDSCMHSNATFGNRSLTLGRCASNASQSPWCTKPVLGSMMIIHRKWGYSHFHTNLSQWSITAITLLYLGERTLGMKFNVSSKWPMARGTFSISNLLILGTSHPMSFWEDRHD